MDYDKMSWRDLHIKQGHLQQLKRHVEGLYPLLKKETIEDFELKINSELKVIEFTIKHYKK